MLPGRDPLPHRRRRQVLAQAGYHVLAPDQRGYASTTGWDGRYDGDLAQYRMLNLVEDAVQLLTRTAIENAHVVGHDFGSPVAAYFAPTRPLDARGGRRHAPLRMLRGDSEVATDGGIWVATGDKSADWRGNKPFRLEGWTAAELAKMPTYYPSPGGSSAARTAESLLRFYRAIGG